MADYYSDHFTLTGSAQTAPDRNYKAPVGIAHSRLRYKKAVCTCLALTTEQQRFMTFKSTDRIIEMYVTSGGLGANGTLDFGLYYTGIDNDGAVIDVDLFCSALATSTAILRVEHLEEAGTLTDADRGNTLWSLNTGHALWTADPGGTFDLVGTCVTTFITLADWTKVEVYYLSGD